MDKRSAFCEMESALRGKTPKEQFDALIGPQRLWWKYCQGAVSLGQGLTPGCHLAVELVDSQARSEEESQTFIAAIRAMTGLAQVLAGHQAEHPGSSERG